MIILLRNSFLSSILVFLKEMRLLEEIHGECLLNLEVQFFLKTHSKQKWKVENDLVVETVSKGIAK